MTSLRHYTSESENHAWAHPSCQQRGEDATVGTRAEEKGGRGQFMKTSKTSLDDSMRRGGGERKGRRRGGGKPNHRECLLPLPFPFSLAAVAKREGGRLWLGKPARIQGREECSRGIFTHTHTHTHPDEHQRVRVHIQGAGRGKLR